jgi:hypothetical protein
MGKFWDRMRTIFNQMRRGVKMGIRKYSKTFKNIQKLGKNIQKLTRNIRKYSKILQVLAHLIDFL